MRMRSVAAVGAALAMVVTSATSAAAAPPPCPGFVEKGPGRYRLATDSTCDLSALADGTSVDLAGRTLTAAPGAAVVDAADLTLAKGNLRAERILWSGDRGRLDKVDVSSTTPGAATVRFFLEVSGEGMTVTRSRFHDLPNATALSFYFAGQGTVSDSTFKHTGTGVSVQNGDGFTIERSTFAANETGLRLYNEDGGGVNDVVVRGNVVKDNTGAGLRVVLRRGWPGVPAPGRTLDGVLITHNRMVRNGGPGIDLTVQCAGDPARCDLGQSSVVVTGNELRQNGTAPLAGLGDDGFSARTLVHPNASPSTEGLSVVTVSGNRAERNADRGFEVSGVTDGGGNTARRNGHPEPCLGVVCR